MTAPLRRFRMLLNQREREQVPPNLYWVPWDFLAPHEAWAKRNHDQTLQRLAERGGLGPDEMVAIVEGRRWHRMEMQDAVDRLQELLTEWTKPQPPRTRDQLKAHDLLTDGIGAETFERVAQALRAERVEVWRKVRELATSTRGPFARDDDGRLRADIADAFETVNAIVSAADAALKTEDAEP